tara:strand:- start:281 stop:736 length:456 start_codon:yes stop_codon:yes gene_type:complete
MLEFQEALQKLKNSKTFKDYLKNNKDSYLTSAVYLEELQINYFSPSKQEITIFKIKGKIISETQKEARNFPQLNSNLKTDLKEALKIFRKQKNKFYPKTATTKTIIVLQQSKGPEWNISQLTSSIKILNIKISALTGKITRESFDKLIDLK